MRTTLTLDDDLYRVLEREADAKRISFKEMVNSTLRRGLAAQAGKNPAPHPKVKVRPFPGGLLPGTDPDRMNQFADELEVEAFLSQALRDGAKS